MSYHPSLNREAFQVALDLLKEFPEYVGQIRKKIPEFEKLLFKRGCSHVMVNDVLWRLQNIAAPDPWDRSHLI